MRIFNLLGICLAAIAIAMSSYQYYNQKKVGVVDILKLVNNYKLKKDLVKRLEGQLRTQKDEVDSLREVYKRAPSKEMENFLVVKESAFQNSLEYSSKEIDEQVWKRLNPLIDEYGKTHGYDVIYGANGMGSILYCKDDNTITDEVLEYINSKYDGK